MEGILFVLVTGCQWGKLPKCFPSSSTCWRRFDEWTRWGIFEGLWFALLEQLEELGHIDWREAAADAWFARAKKGDSVGNTKCGKGCKVVDIVDTKGTPLAVHITAANHNEVKLIEPTLDQLQLPHRVPEHLIYDRAADSDALPKRLMDQRGSNWFAHIARGGRQSPRRMVEPVESTSDATKWNGPTAGSTTSAERSFATKPHCFGTPAGST